MHMTAQMPQVSVDGPFSVLVVTCWWQWKHFRVTGSSLGTSNWVVADSKSKEWKMNDNFQVRSFGGSYGIPLLSILLMKSKFWILQIDD